MPAPSPIIHSSPHTFLGPSGTFSKLAQPSGYLHLETVQDLESGNCQVHLEGPQALNLGGEVIASETQHKVGGAQERGG